MRLESILFAPGCLAALFALFLMFQQVLRASPATMVFIEGLARLVLGCVLWGLAIVLRGVYVGA